jgi:hypothetical protein
VLYDSELLSSSKAGKRKELGAALEPPKKPLEGPVDKSQGLASLAISLFSLHQGTGSIVFLIL